MKQFIKLENEVLFNDGIKPNEKKIYLVLIKQRNTKTNITKVTYRELEDYTGIRYQNIKDYFNNLVTNHLIEIISKDKNGTEIQILNNRPDKDYTEITYEYVVEKKIEDVLDYYYLLNLIKMNGGFDNIKYFTKKYNTKARFKSVSELFTTMLHLSEQGLGSFKFKFDINNEKNEQPAQAQDAQKEESTSIIYKQGKNIIQDYQENTKYLHVKLEYDRAKQMLECYQANENDKTLDEETINEIKDAIVNQREVVKELEQKVEMIKNELTSRN